MYNIPQKDKLAVVKNWLGRKGLQYLETLMTTERETCSTLEGLFETLSNKFKPQYSETIKSLQFRMLYRYEDENVEEWMGRLCIAAVECNYQEVDRQLKEQFIHGLNDKYMLEEIMKELTATKNDDHITSGGILAWAKRVEVQRAQAAVLNTLSQNNLIKSKYQRKQKMTKPELQYTGPHSNSCADTVGESTSQGSAQHTARHVWSVAMKDTSGRSATVEGAGWSMRWSKRCPRSTRKVILK